MEKPLAGLLDLTMPPGATLARRLTDQIRTLISEGRLGPGEPLPSSRALARGLGVSRNTVNQALGQLAAEGYLDTGQSRRPRVAPDTPVSMERRDLGSAPAPPPGPAPSRWARLLPDLAWPPAYGDRPRPFQPGLADEREFPHAIWGRCLRRAANQATRWPRTARGSAPDDPTLQEVLLAHLAARRGVQARPDQVLLVPSAQAGLHLVARTMTDPGDVAWIESPGYGGGHAALRAAGAEVAGIPLDADGLAVVAGQPAPRLLIVTPSHQYPTGRLMPAGRRLLLLRYAGEVGAAIVEDDYDGDFHYDGRPVAALAGLDPAAAVFYVGTFSKAMTAAIRVGYVVVPEAFLPAIRLARRHLGLLVPAATQAALAEFIASGDFLAHVRRMTRLYRTRRDHLVRALAAAAGTRLAVEVPAGGMQLLARCGEDVDDVALCRALSGDGVVARPLSEMLHHPARDRGLFLGFSAWNEEETSRGAEVIGRNLPRHT